MCSSEYSDDMMLICWFQRQASLSTLQSKMAKQKRVVKKELNGAAKKKMKKTDVDMDNSMNVVKVQQLKSVDDSHKPTMNSDSKNKPRKPSKQQQQAVKEMNDVKIQVSHL